MLIGIPLMGACFILLKFANALWTFYVLVGLIGFGFGLSLFIAPHAAIANWFLKRRSLALALLLIGPPLGREIAKFTIGGFINQHGWQVITLALGIVILAIGIPLALLMRHKPEQYGYLPDGKQAKANEAENAIVGGDAGYGVDFTLREALKTRAFWLLTIAMIIGTAGAITMSGYVFFPDKEFIEPENLAHIFSFLPLFGILGILIFGYLGDVFTKRYLLPIAIAIQGISAVVLITSASVWQIYLFMILYGLGSGLIPLMFAIRADYFGRNAFATITVVMLVIIGLLQGLAQLPLAHLSGWLIDITESHQAALILSMVVCFIAAAVFFFAKPPRPPKRVIANE
jgi:sugar phosphate permease